MQGQPRRLERRHDALIVLGTFSFITGCLSIAIMSLLALVTRQAFIFPSLGPTAFLFFYTPLAPAASPRNAIYGHLISVAAGWGSLWVFRLEHAGPALPEGVDGARVAAAALSLRLTSGLMVLLKSPHPPAGATTLIISLGILTEPVQMLVLMIAVLVLTGQAFMINRLAGLPYPTWAPRANRHRPSLPTRPDEDGGRWCAWWTTHGWTALPDLMMATGPRSRILVTPDRSTQRSLDVIPIRRELDWCGRGPRSHPRGHPSPACGRAASR